LANWLAGLVGGPHFYVVKINSHPGEAKFSKQQWFGTKIIDKIKYLHNINPLFSLSHKICQITVKSHIFEIKIPPKEIYSNDNKNSPFYMAISFFKLAECPVFLFTVSN